MKDTKQASVSLMLLLPMQDELKIANGSEIETLFQLGLRPYGAEHSSLEPTHETKRRYSNHCTGRRRNLHVISHI
jgi:hypothetical protein